MIQSCLIWLVKAYRLLLSPWLGSACRFEPTCSVYALGVLEQHGAFVGSYLTVHRLARCQPWCDGGHDPIPDAQAVRERQLFSRLMPSSASSSSTKKSS